MIKKRLPPSGTLSDKKLNLDLRQELTTEHIQVLKEKMKEVAWDWDNMLWTMRN